MRRYAALAAAVLSATHLGLGRRQPNRANTGHRRHQAIGRHDRPVLRVDLKRVRVQDLRKALPLAAITR